jgi:hypothetical protein
MIPTVAGVVEQGNDHDLSAAPAFQLDARVDQAG